MQDSDKEGKTWITETGLLSTEEKSGLQLPQCIWRKQMCGVVPSNNLTGRSHTFLSAHVSDVLPIKTKALRGREGGKKRTERGNCRHHTVVSSQSRAEL